MKRVHSSVIWILIFSIVTTQCAYGAIEHSYHEYIRQAKIAFVKKDYPKALFYIQTAHLTDRSKTEHFKLLNRIPPFSEYYKSLTYYYDLATGYYFKEDYLTARFFYEAAYNVDPQIKGLKEMVEHVDRVIDGEERPRISIHSGVVPRYEMDPVYVNPDNTRRERNERYHVKHSVEVDAIIAKYQGNKAVEKKTPHQLATIKRKAEKAIVKQKAITTLTSKDDQPVQYRKTYVPGSSGRRMPITQIPRSTQKETVDKETTYSSSVRKTATAQSKQQERLSASKKEVIEAKETIRLDEELWARQPGTVLEIEFGKSIELEGSNIKRYLVFDQEIIDVSRTDKDSLIVTIKRRGSTLFHIWDDKGRWTFNVKGIIPAIKSSRIKQIEDDLEKHATPFTISYSNNWNSFYLGNSLDNLDRMNLSFTQWIGIYGETPYGFVDASANFFKFAESTENTGRTVGLSGANFGPFEDFNIRGWDASKRFSNLSMPGRSFRGVLFDSFALDHQVLFTFLEGQDRANFRQVSEGVVEVRKSYIEGGRITLFPEQKRQFSFNYARGHGEERPDFLKERVFSIEAKDTINNIDAHLEVAYDEDKFGTLLLTEYDKDDLNVKVNLRDLEPGFTTITSRPSGSGEIGANFILSYEPEDYRVTANLDLYRDRDLENPDDPNNVNIDFGTVYGRSLSETLKWNSSLFFNKTPQLVSPRHNLRLNTTLTKSFELFNKKTLTTFLTGSYQRSRYQLSSSSEFDRFGLGVGIRIPILSNLSFFANYDYSFVDVIESNELNKPNVLNTGLSYYKNINNNISTRLSVSYRNEEDTEGEFSFLSGTDVLRTNVGVSYRPKPEIEIFIDGSIRNVWSEASDQKAFNDADLRFGLRTTWDTVFRWDPKATIMGNVYKDLNRNSKQDDDEPGIEGIEIQLGRKSVKTNRWGRYKGKVRAKEIKMGVNFNTVPQGYSLLSYLMKEIKIKHGETYKVDFGFITRSGIYGVFFHDLNGNQKYEDGEPTVAKAKIKLNNREIAQADFEGVFNFYDIKPGEHTLMVDVNSLPLEYLPTIKLRSKIDLQEGTTYRFYVPLKKK